MVNARYQPDADTTRFNVLLTEDRRRVDEPWSEQLPRLLQPQGVRAYVARSGREAVDLVTTVRIHTAVIDLATPLGESAQRSSSPEDEQGDDADDATAGLSLLEVFRRLPHRPPIVVVSSLAPTQREAHRLLNEALRLGVFSVVSRPLDVEDLLAVIRRVVDRQYRGHWPAPPLEPPSESDVSSDV